MAGPGGRIAPDGRPAQAPGVGKNAKRHDLEAPATPGLHGSDLQQGDVQMLEQGQRVAPRPKKTQGAAAPAPARRNAPVGETPMEVPDPLEFAAGRIGGNVVGAEPAGGPLFDAEKWRPLLESIARNPQASGPLSTTIMKQLANMSRQPATATVTVVDQNAADEAIRRSL